MISIFYSRNRHVFTFDSLKEKKVRDVIEQVVEQDKRERAVLTCEGKPIASETAMETLFEESAVFLVTLPKDQIPEVLTKPIEKKALEEVGKMINGYAKLYDKRLISGAVQDVIAHDFLGILFKTYPELLYVPSKVNAFRDSRILITMLFEEPDKSFSKMKEKIPLFLGFKTLLTLMKNPMSKQLNPLELFSNLAQMAGEEQEAALPVGGSRVAPVALSATDDGAGPSVSPAPNRASDPAGNPVTREMLTEAIAFAMNSINPGANPPVNPLFGAIPVPIDDEMGGDEQEEEGRDNIENYRVIFRSQLERLVEFGFDDEEENIRALLASGGDLDFALNIIIAARESN
ncbi:unnamed protein product [Auanema sp. JU1783]|nr:unnamed protein product [Auanema sp. JU1783]